MQRYTRGGNTTGSDPPTLTPTPSNPVRSDGRTSRSSNIHTEIDHSCNEVQDTETGRRYLEKTLISQVGVDFTIEHVVSCLHHITQLKNISLPATTAIRAIAYILEEHAVTTAYSLIADKVSNMVIQSIADHVAKNLQVSMDNASSTFDDIHSRLETISTQIDKSTSAIHHNPPPINSTTPNAAFLYRDALLGSNCTSDMLPMLDQQRARTEAKSRQILLDPIPNNSVITAETTHAELVKKLKDALSEAYINDITCDLKPAIKSVTRIRNGGIILELDSAPSVAWLKSSDVRNHFIQAMNAAVSFRDRTYSILVPFLPIRVNPELEATHRAIEEENSIEMGVIVNMRWIKPSNRRNPQQQYAHAMLVLSDPAAANHLL
ncbi:hypothetical protein BV22DRAFT_1024006, partial [Leucogyrophana mollusca]